MADRHLPLSGAVTQTFNAWNNMLRSVSGQLFHARTSRVTGRTP